MSNSLIFSALTVVALTGTYLIHLKHGHDSENLHKNENISDDYHDYDYEYENRFNPKIVNVMNKSELKLSGKLINKRSVSYAGYGDTQQLSIDDKNITQVDYFKRDKIKKVIYLKKLRYLFFEHIHWWYEINEFVWMWGRFRFSISMFLIISVNEYTKTSLSLKFTSIIRQLSLFIYVFFNFQFRSDTDDGARLEQLQALRMG